MRNRNSVVHTHESGGRSDNLEPRLEFLLLMVNADEECVNDEEFYILYERMEELCSTEIEIDKFTSHSISEIFDT
jgi:hypothetical protein